MPDKLIGATCFPDTLPRYKIMYELATTASFGGREELFVQDLTSLPACWDTRRAGTEAGYFRFEQLNICAHVHTGLCRI
jgi:hypothetical protein